MRRFDHLVYTAPELEAAVDELERLLGVRATPGGKHPAWATHNALLALGDDAYLEIMAPEPEQPAPARPRPLGLDERTSPRIVTWVAKSEDLEGLVERAKNLGVDLGGVRTGSRRRHDGETLSWMATDLSAPRMDGLIPFFIDWGRSRHPATSAAGGCSLIRLQGEHPQDRRVREMLEGLGLDLQVDEGPEPALVATIRSPQGVVELR